MSKRHPGHCERKGMSLVELVALFPANESAEV